MVYTNQLIAKSCVFNFFEKSFKNTLIFRKIKIDLLVHFVYFCFRWNWVLQKSFTQISIPIGLSSSDFSYYEIVFLIVLTKIKF